MRTADYRNAPWSEQLEALPATSNSSLLYQSKGTRNPYLDAYGLTSVKEIPSQEAEADIMSKASADIFDKFGSFDNLSVKERVNKLRDTFLSILKPASQSGTATPFYNACYNYSGLQFFHSSPYAGQVRQQKP